jgi:hypothetical protein
MSSVYKNEALFTNILGTFGKFYNSDCFKKALIRDKSNPKEK